MKIVLNNESFRYDVHSMVKAFYPKEELEFKIVLLFSDSLELSFPDSDTLKLIIPDSITENRTEAKNIFKRALYQALSHKTNTRLPWGTLTGIRPIKIPAKLIREGKDRDYIFNYMRNTYFISENKANLAIDIAENEKNLFERAFSGRDYKDFLSLYIGIPFCPSICAYCSFSSYPLKTYESRVEEYLECLIKELKDVAFRLNNKPVKTVYIGGGTPSTLSPQQLSRLCEVVNSSFNLSSCYEFSVECGRPDSITREKLEALKESGVDRISINPQTMNDKTLKLIGRAHNSSDIEKAFQIASPIGFKSINCDLIAGLPGEGREENEFTLDKIEKLNPDNITVHSLAIKRAADLNLTWDSFSSELSLEDYDLFTERISKMGHIPYYLYRQKQIAGNLENTGFCRKGLECLYNCLIMGEYHDIIACGAGAVSKFIRNGKPERVSNIKDVLEYISRIDELIERKAKWL